MRVPGYEVVELLDRAGNREVYRAEADDREVAVRVDTRTVPDERRFRDDVRTAERLSAHPYVVEVHDGGVLPDARPYLVMELCQDRSLAARAPLPPSEVAEIGQRIADVLVAAHDLGLAHGAITPAELLVKPVGTVGLAGFGLATLYGTPTQRADVRDLTATLYELVAGSPPRDPAEDLPGVSSEFMAILRRGLLGRYSDAAALRADLSQLTVATAPHRPVTSSSTSSTASSTLTSSDDTDGRAGSTGSPGGQGSAHPPEPTASPETGRRVLLVASALVVVLVAVVVGWLILAG
jgi:serine/threonine protein kinase